MRPRLRRDLDLGGVGRDQPWGCLARVPRPAAGGAGSRARPAFPAPAMDDPMTFPEAPDPSRRAGTTLARPPPEQGSRRSAPDLGVDRVDGRPSGGLVPWPGCVVAAMPINRTKVKCRPRHPLVTCPSARDENSKFLTADY